MGKSLVHLPHQQKRIKGEEGAGLTEPQTAGFRAWD